MVDEFQDASQARARLVAGLMRGPEKYLFAVGDDWQSINRFAGADLAVMTDFEAKFGKGVTLRLETTFRCPPSLCEISSTFVRKNPRQIAKKVRSPKPDIENPVRIVSVESEHHIRSAVEARVNEIAQEAASVGKKATVYLLGRYRKDAAFLPATYNAQWIEVEFITVHSSKGLEADHVILPRMTIDRGNLQRRLQEDHQARSPVLTEAILIIADAITTLYDDRAGRFVVQATDNGPEFGISIEGDRGGGISNIEIFCFDLALFKVVTKRLGGPTFLLHDSHLFDGVDERQIAGALLLGMEATQGKGLQYIVTMNSDIFERLPLPKTIDPGEVVLDTRLSDQGEAGGLFGFRFG